MSDERDFANRVGTAVNELDIDFSRFTTVGWLVSLISVGIGGGAAFLVCQPLVQRNGLSKGVGLTFFVTILAVTVMLFMVLSRVATMLEMPIVRDSEGSGEPAHDIQSQEDEL